MCVSIEFPCIEIIMDISSLDVCPECLAPSIVVGLDILMVLVVYARYAILVVPWHSLLVGKVIIVTNGHIMCLHRVIIPKGLEKATQTNFWEGQKHDVDRPS